MRRSILIATLVLAGASPVAAQFSSDLPGVPRAAIPFRGSVQTRWAWDVTGYRITEASVDSGTTAVGLSLSYGRSYRVLSQFEVSLDFTLAEALRSSPPEPTLITPAGDSTAYMRGSAFYGFRVGGKWRPLSSVDPDGYGWEVAVGAGFQPAIKPLFAIESINDSVRTGGQFSKSEDDSVAVSPTFSPVHMSTQLAAMGSYRSRRFMADAALVLESAEDVSLTEPSPLGRYDGVSPRIGAAYRLTRSFSIGGSYWGTGAPPWRNRILHGRPGVPAAEEFGLLLGFGSTPEAGLDLMISSPTGNFTESVSLYARFRNTR